MEKFLEFLNQNNITYTDEMLEKLDIYYEFLIEYNKNVNLTTIIEKEDVYIKHFADSLLGLEYIRNNSTVCDIGTGAGFPGLVLKIFNPTIKLYLVDSLQKRIIFLKKLINKLNIDDVTIIHARAEDNEFKDKYLNSFDNVVSRAVANLRTLCEYCLPYLKIGGEMIAYKSENTNIELTEAKNAIKVLGGSFIECHEKKLFDYKRSFIVIKKISLTDKKYPRGQNKPRLLPL